jgi:predicted RNase H-like nuclease (RuvC/YqgF family)
MDKLNQLRADKFFGTEKNLVAIETLDTLIKDSLELLNSSINKINRVKSKLQGLERKLSTAVDNSDVAKVKELIAATKPIEKFIEDFKGKDIAKFEVAKTSFDIE